MAQLRVPFTADVTALTAVCDMLPASFRTQEDGIVQPSTDNLDFLKHELLVPRIDKIWSWLWICGRPMPPRPLHKQIVMDREVVITEDPELHLVWAKKKIYLKPIPRWLLDRAFWTDYICGNSDKKAAKELTECGRGFLFLYCALISYPSDFRIASERGLLPADVTWETWKQLSAEILENHDYALVNPRYWYGELRLGRLNKIYMFRRWHIFRGYASVGAYAAYVDLLRDQFAFLAAVLAYVVIVLTALQVGFSVDSLKANSSFQNASFGFTIFSIIAPLGSVCLILSGAFILFLFHWRSTKRYEPKRFHAMGVEKVWKQKK